MKYTDLILGNKKRCRFIIISQLLLIMIVSCGNDQDRPGQDMSDQEVVQLLRISLSKSYVFPFEQLYLHMQINGTRVPQIYPVREDYVNTSVTLQDNFNNVVVIQWYRDVPGCKNPGTGISFVAEKVVTIPIKNGVSDVSALSETGYNTNIDSDGDGITNIDDLEPCNRFSEPEMVALPGDCFQMGSVAHEAGREQDELRHTTCVGSFAIGQYEISMEQFDTFACATKNNARGDSDQHLGPCNLGPSDGGSGRGDRPVVGVSWHDANAFVDWLNGLFNKNYRLPTEAEWEYMARAGTETAFSTGSDIAGDQANYIHARSDTGNQDCGLNDHTVGNAQRVGSYSPNNWDLYDVHGNVSEWTCSEYDKQYTNKELQCSGDNTVPRVVRGGSWRSHSNCLRTANRHSELPDTATPWIGFRIAEGDAP